METNPTSRPRYENTHYVYLLKGDDNVLFILDQTRGFRVGTADLSYTLNRVDSQEAGN
ncbi:hypothetical protein [Fibrella forsythiae]|uniref:Uncharacterized protein n=1 Tax=Fibrella forsythiae TaxID=2817061 RepID=A0ABS3JGA0_9BACT|nr:hypothetical protein [Fibrella forsythiae]MBO0948448.1 hypothetical protein [Fibrella forsythiae]